MLYCEVLIISSSSSPIRVVSIPMVVYEHTDETQIKFALMWKEIFASFILISNIYKIFPFAQPNLHRTKTFFSENSSNSTTYTLLLFKHWGNFLGGVDPKSDVTG